MASYCETVCFVCACPAATEPLRTCPDAKNPNKIAHFPLLRSLRPPPGVARPEDTVQVCRLCTALLSRQWNMQEKRNVPVASRQYWTKSWVPNDGSFTTKDNTLLSPPLSRAGTVTPPTLIETKSHCATVQPNASTCTVTATVTSTVTSNSATSTISTSACSTSTAACSTSTSACSTSSTCTMCSRPVTDGLKTNPMLLTLVPDFAPRFAPSMLEREAVLCSNCASNAGLQNLLKMINASCQQQTPAAVENFFYEILRQNANDQQSYLH